MTQAVEIIKETQSDAIEAKVLGQRVSAPTKYTPSVLVAIPRSENRVQYQIDDDTFTDGVDTWRAFETSFLLPNGLPVILVTSIVVSCFSEYIVESKSLKLYLNSFNMERLTGVQEFVDIVSRDLSDLLRTEVLVSACTPSQYETIVCHDSETDVNIVDIPVGDQSVLTLPCQTKFEDPDFAAMSSLVCTEFTEAPHLLKGGQNEAWVGEGMGMTVTIPFLRSNCKVTHQPDWGTLEVAMWSADGRDVVTVESLIQYMVSFRNESHFHEEVCEMITKRLKDAFDPDVLVVRCLYTRRGGIDINPSRVILKEDIPLETVVDFMSDSVCLLRKTATQ